MSLDQGVQAHAVVSSGSPSRQRQKNTYFSQGYICDSLSGRTEDVEPPFMVFQVLDLVEIVSIPRSQRFREFFITHRALSPHSSLDAAYLVP
jgi:hypothetical protein